MNKIDMALSQLLNCLYREAHPVLQKNNSHQFHLIKRLKASLYKESLLGPRYFHSIRDVDTDKDLSFLEMIDLVASEAKLEKITQLLQKNEQHLNFSLQLKREYEKKKKQSLAQFSYINSEQSLFLGHPFHPIAQFKGDMDLEVTTPYLPIAQNSFKLIWVEFSSDTHIEYFGEQLSFKEKLFKYDAPIDFNFEHALIFHPLQWNSLQKEVKALRVSEGRLYWQAQSSMRTLFQKDLNIHLKCSLPLQLTNSNRVIQKSEALRSIRLRELIPSDFPIERDLSFQMIKDIPLSLSLIREKKVRDDFRLAAYLFEPVFDERFKINLFYDYQLDTNKGQEHRLYCIDFFQSYLNKVISPLLELKNKEGIYLGAHLQNLLLKLNTKGLVEGFLFRDSAGFALSSNHSKKIESDFLIESKNTYQKIFGYYLFVNNLFIVISQLAFQDCELEKRLLYELWRFLKGRFDEEYEYLMLKEYYQKDHLGLLRDSEDESLSTHPWKYYIRFKNPCFDLLKAFESHVENFLLPHDKKKYIDIDEVNQVSFRPFDLEKDLEIFHHWQHKDYIKEFWEMDHDLETHKSYLQSKLTQCFIAEVENRPVGYFEFYWALEDRIFAYLPPGELSSYDQGLHLLIGDESLLGGPFVKKIIHAATDFLFKREPRCKRIYAEPRSDNKKILAIARALKGWRELYVFQFPHKESMLLVCDRGDYEA